MCRRGAECKETTSSYQRQVIYDTRKHRTQFPLPPPSSEELDIWYGELSRVALVSSSTDSVAPNKQL